MKWNSKISLTHFEQFISVIIMIVVKPVVIQDTFKSGPLPYYEDETRIINSKRL